MTESTTQYLSPVEAARVMRRAGVSRDQWDLFLDMSQTGNSIPNVFTIEAVENFIEEVTSDEYRAGAAEIERQLFNSELGEMMLG
jgi:hypothetical protein